MPIAFPQMISSFKHTIASFKMLLATLLISICFLQPTTTNARAILYDGRDGLNSNDIKCIAKDNRGLIWIGTFNGLNIFDGYTFTRTQGILSDRNITKLKNNPFENELLVGTTTGFFKLDLNTFKTYKLNYQGDSKIDYSNIQTRAISVNHSSKEVYIAIGHNLIAKIENNKQFKIICRLKDSTAIITELTAYDKDHLIVNNGSLYLINVRTGASEPLKAFRKMEPIYSIARSEDKFLFCGINSHIYTTNIQSLEGNPLLIPNITKHDLPFKPIRTILKGDKLYCLCDNYSFLIINLKTNKIDNISQKYPEIFEGKVFYTLFVDENEIAWIGTNKGMIKVEERPISFNKELSNMPERVSTREIYETPGGDLYVCSYVGLWHLPKGATSWSKYGGDNTASTFKFAHSYNGYVQPLSLLYNPDANLFYVGFDGQRILKFDISQKIFEDTKVKFKNSSDILEGVSDLEMDKNNKIWMASMRGLAIYDLQTNTVTLDRAGGFSLGKIRVRQLYNDKVNSLMYAATTNGLFVVDINKGVIKHLTTNSNPALNNNDIFFVSKDNDNNIWLGTNGGGINVVSPDGKQVKFIRKQDGLSSEIVYSMIQENGNIFWFGTFNGLDRYQKDKNAFTNFFEEDGLSSNEFNQNSFLRTRENLFCFGSINGLTTFKPRQFMQPVPFHIYFAGISKWDDKSQSVQLFLQNLETGSTIEKSPSEQLVELHFGCSDYSDPQRNSYSYRIREISENWIALEDRHSLNISGLPYGDFTLEVKAINARGGASSNILLYNLEILQPFYRTWWFFALLLISVCLLFYGAYLIKYQGFKNILHLRMKIASNLHDDVGSLLTRITMFSENLRYSNNNEEQRNIKLEKIAVLSRNAVASMSDVLWTIDSRNDFTGNLLDRMREHAEEMLFPLGIDVNFVLAVNDLKKHISSDTRGEIYLIYKEAINNIAKHSNATHVEIFYSFHDKYFHLKISNNGIKESISEISTGQGLGNMKMRAKKIGAQITVEKVEDKFIIELKN